MKSVNVHEAKTNFSKLLAEVEKLNQPILICRNGKPVAELTPRRRLNRITPHPELRRIKIKYDPVEPMDEKEWPSYAR